MTVDPLTTRILDRGEHALARLAAMREADPPTTGGRVLSYVYDSGLSELDQLAMRAARLAHGVNGLDPTVFASVAQIHGGIISRTRSILGAGAGAGASAGVGAQAVAGVDAGTAVDGDVFGSVTSGGTESCILACLAAREVRGRSPATVGRSSHR
ncbi:hypothetical protein ACFSSF_07725 [Dietzia aerolata]|uniref:hypothetical protein n=1 Tax=Dietzia aerolata TaxID=595984 RepID=UPI003643D6F7